MKKIQRLNRESLEKNFEKGCETPGCTDGHDELVLDQRCHLGAGARVTYKKGSNELKIACVVCDKPISFIAVASELEGKYHG